MLCSVALQLAAFRLRLGARVLLCLVGLVRLLLAAAAAAPLTLVLVLLLPRLVTRCVAVSTLKRSAGCSAWPSLRDHSVSIRAQAPQLLPISPVRVALQATCYAASAAAAASCPRPLKDPAADVHRGE